MSARTTAPATKPPTGLPPGVHTGPLAARLVGQLIDVVVPAVLLSILLSADLTTSGAVLLVLLLVGWLVLLWRMVAVRAASPGMRLMKLQLVGLRDGRPIGWSRFAARELVLLGLTATVVGLLAMLFLLVRHPRRQGWHDLVAASVVIKQRALAPPLPRRRPVWGRAAGSKASVPRTPDPSRRPPTPVPPAPEPERVASMATTAARTDPARLDPASFDAATPDPGRTDPGRPDPARPDPGKPSGSTRVDPAAAAPPRAVPESPAWTAVLDDGRSVDVTGVVLLGRNPQGRPGEEDAELVKVTDESRTVSKTHLALGLDSGGLFVMDRGSTNGSTLTNASGVSSPCYPGDVVPVPEGSIVSFGDHWLRVERHRGE